MEANIKKLVLVRDVILLGFVLWTLIYDWDQPSMVFALMIFVLGLFILLLDWVEVYRSRLSFNDQSVEGQKGLFRIRTLSCPIAKIQSIAVKKTLFGQMLNFGTVEIKTAAGLFCFKFVKDAEKFKDELMRKALNLESPKGR